MGGVQNSSGNSGGVGGGGVILVVNKWKFRGGGGTYVKFPPWWGYGHFLELHIGCTKIGVNLTSKASSMPSSVMTSGVSCALATFSALYLSIKNDSSVAMQQSSPLSAQ